MEILSSLFDNLDEALIILDADGNILLVNEVASKIGKEVFLSTLNEGINIADIVDLKSRAVLDNFIGEVTMRKSRERYCAELLNTNGVTITLDFSAIPVVDDDGKLKYIHLIIRDLTTQKVFNKKVLAQSQYITDLIEKANAIIIGLDTSGYITNWNEHSAKVTGFSKNDVYGQKFINVLLPDLDQESFRHIVLNGCKQEIATICELPIRAKDGAVFTILFSSTPILSVLGDVVGLTLVGQDITELTEYRLDLEKKVTARTAELGTAMEKEKQLIEMKGKFISNAAHEFRTPLTSISIAAGFLRKYKANMTEDAVDLKLESIERQVTYMSTLLDDILMFGKGDAGMIQVRWSSLGVRNCFESIARDVVNSIKGNHGINLKIDFPDETFRTDSGLIRNVLVNLLNNAVKFSHASREIDLTVAGTDTEMIIIIRDYGIGIMAEDIPQLFSPFYRGSNVSSISGTGLGLSIVKNAIDLLGGQIKLNSVNCGTEFIVTLPMSLGKPNPRHETVLSSAVL